MEIKRKYVREFLEKKGFKLNWCLQPVTKDATNDYWEGNFESGKMLQMGLSLGNKALEGQFLITSSLFVILNSPKMNTLIADYSNQWKKFLISTIKKENVDIDTQTKIKNFNAYLEESIDE